MDEKEVLRIIKQAAEKGETSLHLSDKELTSIPPQIGSITELRELWLSRNKLSSVPGEIGKLTNLHTLILEDNEITSLPTDIANLINLRTLAIDRNKLTSLPMEIGALRNLRQLDLGHNQLTSLPTEIGNLINLIELWIENNRLRGLPQEIGNLTNLRHLDLRDNQLSSLPGEIGNLVNLMVLYLHDNKLTILPNQIGNITELRELWISNNKLTSLPAEIGNLSYLRELHIDENRLSSLPPEIGNLKNLNELSVMYNQLSSLPAQIGNLTNLRHLAVSGNNLSQLPPEISLLKHLNELWVSTNKLQTIPPQIGNLAKLSNLEIVANPLISPPPEIINQGTKAVLAYLRSKLKEKRRQWISKMLLVGEGGVGKTSLLRALLSEPFNLGEETTHGIDIRPLELKHSKLMDLTMQLNTWDFGGQHIYHSTHQFFLTQRSLFILVWDLRHGWKAGELYKWLDIIKARAPESPVIIVGAHLDERDCELPFDDMVCKYPQIVGHYKVSNKDSRGIERVRQAIANAASALPLMGEEWPADWLNAAYAIRESPENCIRPKKLFELMDEHGVSGDYAPVLAQWLHELGDILYFHDDAELNDTVILNPHWVTKHISDVLECEEVKDDGIFTRSHMDRLWYNLEPWTRGHFLRLMEQFDLSYRTLEDKDISIVVERLSLDPPDYKKKWHAIRERAVCNEISMKFYLHSTLPPGIPTWFIARSHRFTTYTHWRYGALFADTPDKKHLGLIRAFDHDRYLHLTVRGPSPQNFFALLKDGLDLTLARYPGLDIKRTIPCPGHNGKPCSHEFDYENLQKAIEKEPPLMEVQCPVSFEVVSVPGLLFGLHWRTQDAVISEIRQLAATNAEEHAALLALLQREFAKNFRIEQSKIESHCPNVFALRPMEEKMWGVNWFRNKIELQLYCQEPGCWHPTVQGGRYVINKPAGWIRALAPYIRAMVGVLKYASPLVEPALGAAKSEIEKTMRNDLKLMNELVKKLPDIEDSREVELTEEIGEERYIQRAEGAELRGLRRLLKQFDPEEKWGGLKKLITPEGHCLWLCRYHAAKYNPQLPAVEESKAGR